MYVVGIDISKYKHDAALLTATDALYVNLFLSLMINKGSLSFYKLYYLFQIRMTLE